MAEKYRHWCFTLNNYVEDDITELPNLSPKYKYLVVGKEVGDSGTPHLQGFVSFPNRVRVSSLHLWFSGRAHWEVAKSPANAATYCKKDGDFLEYGISPVASRKGQGKRSDLHDLRDAIKGGETDRKRLREDYPVVCAKYPTFVSQLLLDHIPLPLVEEHPLHDWQQELVDALALPPDSRKIRFIVDTAGGGGKTWFCRYYQHVHGGSILLKPGKKPDMTYALMSLLEATTKVIFVDAPRSKQGEFIQYDFLEEVKDGCILNTKYESRMIRFKHPHVVVMMNERPDEEKLSFDRYSLTVI